MGDKKVSSEAVKAAKDTYNLELSLEGINDIALERAIEAALGVVENNIVESIAREADMYALQCDKDENGISVDDSVSPYAAGLLWFADRLRSRLPSQSNDPYAPQDEDVIEVVLTGPVAVYEDKCENCGLENSVTTWSVYDEATEQEYFFEQGDERKLRIRLLERE